MTFGAYLVECGAVTRRQLLAALTEQRRRSLPIGKLATREHLMSDKDVLQVLDSQLAEPEVLAGELAVAAGLMTTGDVEHLLEMQLDSRERVGEVLVEMGAISEEELEHRLREYAARSAVGAE
jgi:hypothetical protein